MTTTFVNNKKLYVCVTTYSLVISLIINLVTICTSYADTAYSWRDENGRIVFGNKPPANKSTGAKKVSATLSKYSSNKMFSHYRVKPKTLSDNNLSNKTKEFDLLEGLNLNNMESINNNPSADLTKNNTQNDNGKNNTTTDKNEDVSNNNLNSATNTLNNNSTHNQPEDGLSHDDLSISYDSIGRIIECSVKVTNVTMQEKKGVTVLFEFDDGTIIKAKGLSTIAPNTSQIFAMPQEIFPFDTRPVANLDFKSTKRAKLGKSKPEEFNNTQNDNMPQWKPVPKIVIKTLQQ